MPHNLVRLAVAAREASAPRAVPAIDEHRSDDEGVTPADEVEERWMRRLAAILDAPTGENSADAAQLTTDLWIGGRSAAMVFSIDGAMKPSSTRVTVMVKVRLSAQYP